MPNSGLVDSPPAPKSLGSCTNPAWYIASAIVWGLLLAMLYFVAPRIEAVFADFGVDLPRISIWAVLASHAVIKHPLAIPFVIGGVLVILACQLRAARPWAVVMLCIPLVLIAASLVAMGLPWLQLCTMQNLSR